MKWYEFEAQNEKKNVIFSTVNIYRNIEKYPFMSRLSSGSSASCAKINEISEKIYEAIITHGYEKINTDTRSKDSLENSISANYSFTVCDETDKLPYLIFHSDDSKNVFVVPCSREHVQISATYPSLSVGACLDDALDAEEKIESECPFAFNSSLGYLMKDADSCGCGVSISVMLFLPMCDNYSKKEDLNLLASSYLAKITPAFPLASLYILTKDITGGINECEGIEAIEELVGKICALEEGLASYMLGREKDTALLREQCACAEYIAEHSTLITPNDYCEIHRALRIRKAMFPKEDEIYDPRVLNAALYLLEICKNEQENASLELCRALSESLRSTMSPLVAT